MTDHRPHNVLVTGGAGFIGCNFLRFLLHTYDDMSVVNLDALTYAGHAVSVEDLASAFPDRYAFEHVDIRDAASVRRVLEAYTVDTIVHFAAETHVDRSIDGPAAFVETNVLGTAVLLDQARQLWAGRTDVRFHHVSTDEVFGSAEENGAFVEDARYDPSSPYAASKAGSDHLVHAWHHTYGLPVSMSNCSNNYGPYQYPEKLLPLVVRKAKAREPVPVYGDGSHVRDWLHVKDHCRAVDAIVRRGRVGARYNVGGGTRLSNLDLVQRICDIVDEVDASTEEPRRSLITFVEDRPGHDRRYAMDSSRIAGELGWEPVVAFDQGLRDAVRWYLDNDVWCRRITEGRYAGQRLGAGL